MKTFHISFIAAILFLVATSCESIKDTYRDFVKDGETIYVGKADSIKVRGGLKRVEISWLLLSDPNVSKYKIFWNNNEKSVEGLVKKTENVDTVKVPITDMEEGVYQFDIVLYDNDGHSSVKAGAIGAVYANRYQSFILNRVHRRAERINPEDLMIEWMRATEDMVQVEMEYKNITGVLRQIVMPASETDVTLTGFPVRGALTYRTAFIPEPAALDTFYTEYQTIIVKEPPVKLNRSKWTFPGYDDNSQDGQIGYSSQNTTENGGVSPNGRVIAMLDGLTSTYWHARYAAPLSSYPHWFIVDLGDLVEIEGVMLQRRQGNANSATGYYFYTCESDPVNQNDPVNGYDWEYQGEYTFDRTINDEQVQWITPSPKARYVKMYFDTKHQATGAQQFNMFSEFALYGTILQ